jgi:ABC-type sugar transport system ATPase subunit
MESENRPRNNSVIDNEILCSMKSITKIFGGAKALQDVNFEIRAGEVHALLGENGAGKSTLMKILYGFYTRTSGIVEINHKSVEFKNTHDAEMAGIGMVPQEIDIIPELDVAENLYVGRNRPKRFGFIDKNAMRAAAKDIFDSLGVEIDVTMQVKHLSVATKQMIEIARAFMRDAKIIIFDEPTAALSERETQYLFSTINGLKSKGIGIVYISHRFEEIFIVADRITVLRDGKLIGTDAVTNFDNEKLVKMMIGRPLSQFFTRKIATIEDVVLKVENLSSKQRYRNVSFELRKGEIVGLAGLVGAGRSEVAQTVYGILKKTGGRIFVRGEEIDIKSPEDALAHGIAYLPEERRSQGLILPISIGRNLVLSSLKLLSRHWIVDRKKEHGLIEKYSKSLEIRGADSDDPVSRLSGGNQQKVVVSKILAREPDIILLDEPTRGIDVGAKSEIYKLISNLAEEGKAILLISSELQEILSMSDRVLVMYEGNLIAEYSGEEINQEVVGAALSGIVNSNDLGGEASVCIS